MNNNKKNKAFTLIELLAVIVILGILLSVSIVAVNNIRKKQDEQNRQNVISAILTGAKECVSDDICTSDNISVSDLLDNNYVDFDRNKYEDLAIKEVKIDTCNNKLKQKYTFDEYNDCGCELQPSTSTAAVNLCSEPEHE